MPLQPLHTRFAPTPSGYLHIGNAFSFVLTWLYARSSGGTIHLRIDDIDGTRARAEYVEDIFKTLNWLGLDWDSGPQNPADFYQYHSQHLRLDLYNSYLNQLRSQGLLFACNCSRKQIHEQSIDGQYSGHCQHLNLPFDAAETAWRIVTPEAANSVFTDVWNTHPPINVYNTMRHFVVRTKEGRAAYQVASVADDVLYNINFIVRGADLLPSTAAQCFLAQQIPALQGFANTRFLHHPLLLDAAGQKLSKSLGSTALVEQYSTDKSPEDVYLQMAKWLQIEKATNATELLAAFKNSKYNA
jgi:glutamyl/glutaminyl-tRNA synthetase